MQPDESCFMDASETITDTVFLVKEEQEHCFLFDSNDPLELLRLLLRNSREEGGALDRQEAFEVMESLVPERLRSI